MASVWQLWHTLPSENLLVGTDGLPRLPFYPAVTSRCGSLLPAASADVRSPDDVIVFEGSTTDATLCWPAGNYTVKVTIYNMDISPSNIYATNSTVFTLQESFERPFPSGTPCYGHQSQIAFREVKGNFCSPSCSSKNKKKPDVDCPPVPSYLNAKAHSLCVLERQGSKGASNCAMMCTLPPNNKDPNTDKTKCTNPPCLCPAGAFCTAVSGAPPPYSGTCIYYPVTPV